MKKYIDLEIEILQFCIEDVVRTSGGNVETSENELPFLPV